MQPSARSVASTVTCTTRTCDIACYMHTRACRTFVPRHALESRVNRTIECAVLRSATQTLKESHPPRPRTILYDEYLSTTRLRGAAEEKLRRDVRSWTRYNELYFLALVGALPIGIAFSS